METYTKAQLKELGIPFYEDFKQRLKVYIENSRYFYIDPSTLDEWEKQELEYQEYLQYCSYYEEVKDLSGPMSLDDISLYIRYLY